MKLTTNLKSLSSITAAIAFLCIPATSFAAPVTGQISLGGYVEAVGSTSLGSATGLDFANASGTSVSGNSGTLTSYGAGSGSFAALGACASTSSGCGTIKDLATFSPNPISSFLTLTTGGPTVSFDLSSIENVTEAGSGSNGSVTFTALGTINFSGFDATAGEFVLTAQGNNIVSFSATTLASALPKAPEPSTSATMGMGILGLGFLSIRRKSKSSSIAA